MTEALAGCDVDCIAVEDGGEALRLATASPFDLLVLDACMPVLGGADVLARLRASDGPSRAARVLATTAADEAASLAALRTAGFDDVLAKPIAADVFRRAVTEHLTLHAAPELDPARACAVAGGDAAIVASLQGLFAAELDALPAEIARLRDGGDPQALRERLHRLDASAGFCGAVALAQAIGRLREVIEPQPWPARAFEELLDVARRTRRRLG